jgi:hypothetical protein
MFLSAFSRKSALVALIGLILLTGSLFAQSNAVRITYSQLVNGRNADRGGTLVMLAGEYFAVTWTDRSNQNLIPQTPTEKEYIDFMEQSVRKVAGLFDGSQVNMVNSFSALPKLVITGETEQILGYTCVKATATLRSNSLEIWFTRDLNIRGTPQPDYGIPDGLVLRTVRNGNFEIIADSVEFFTAVSGELCLPSQMGETTGQALYRHRVTASYIRTVSIFDNVQLSWGNPVTNPLTDCLDSVWHFAGGTVAVKKVLLPEVTSDYRVFAELRQHSAGDAYDRTGSVFIIPAGQKHSMLDALNSGIGQVPAFQARNGKTYQGMIATDDFLPAIELIRFFTPFGIRHFNDQIQVYGQEWRNEAYYKQDITEMLGLFQGEVYIGVFIGNYDAGGHRVSLDLKYYPGSQRAPEPDQTKPWFQPLFNTLNFMEMAGQNYGTFFDTDSLTAEFIVPEGMKNIRLRYISTGHGGWGRGDEFNQKLNEIFIDGNRIYSFIPWRTDCGTFREYNPASGNFWNGLTSSDYSRSGWCPGSISDPVYVPLGDLSPGKHVIKVAIPQGSPEGSSFSSWCVSGLIIGERQ